MARSTVHYADSDTNRILKRLHNKLRPAGTPVQRVEYIIELLLLRIFEVKLVQDPEFKPMRAAFADDQADLLFSTLSTLPNEQILPALNQKFFPFYANILTAARKVWPGNLTTKVQDQLVLIEEVFSNSNFTNNVNSGNMAEIIGLVAELDGDRLLKTDLLGDAIESALSETGGTKDIGLHRTPDHIRHFMTALVIPAFKDRIFDPTVGTGGFMFDSFEYVMQGVSQDGTWPGPKAHHELIAWCKDWFSRHPVPMPGIEASTDFYRTGVGGIEYLGMVRKMAAINFYVRGLNPGNIEQGDALERFGTGILPKSKTVILANPPFGAERDKESYPNVWSEYATETETTILFVKLMLEALKDGGRCAVIVSEGFLTWDQNSARALRRALLEECDLQAVISLPQGLFVNKGGQGPKTSILYFVKGRRTQDVWFYKITNDGYTMGTNRKVQPGCQLVEALDLFHNYVAKGKTPPESRHSFSVPADWIKVLDPRVKDRIRTDTRAEMKEKEELDRAKLTAKLDNQLAARKVTKTQYKAKLEEHAEAWYGKTENLVAQKIERAHAYSFNLPNYRSSLAADQIKAWHDFASSQIQDDDPSKNFERKYRALCEAASADLDRLLSTLDPRHTLELDIARQFLTVLSAGDLKKHPHLRTLQEIIATQQRTPRIPLRDLLTPVCRPAKLDVGRTYRRVTVKLYGKGVRLRDRVTVDDMKGDKWFVVKTGDLIFSKIDARNGAFGIVPEELDDAIVSNEFPVFTINESECRPNVLAALLTTEKFYGQIEEKASGATGRRRLEPDELLEMEVPAMPMVQQEILAKMAEKLSAVSSGAELVIDNWSISPTVFNGQELSLSNIAEIGTGSTPSRTDTKYFNGNIHWVLTAEVDECEIHDTAEKLTDKAVQDYCLRIYPPNTILVAMYGQGKTRGKAALLQVPAAITQNCGGIVIRHPNVLPRYVYYFLRSMYEVIRGQEYSGGGVPHLNLKIVGNIRVPVPNMAEQGRIVAELDAKMAVLDQLRRMRDEAQDFITQSLNRIWEC